MDLAKSGDTGGALKIIEAALPGALDPTPFLALGSLTALRMNAPERAIPFLRDLISLHPTDQASINNLATALVQVGDFDAALQLAEGSPVPTLARIAGYIYQQNGDAKKAATAYRTALDGDPTDLASLNNLGNVLASIDEIDAAIAYFERAITLSPRDLNIYLNLAEVLRYADRPKPRLKVLRDAEKIAPENPRVLIDLGMAYAHNDEIEKSMDVYRRAMALAPEFGEAHIEYGMALEALNRTNELAEFVRQIEFDPSSPEAYFLLAWNAYRQAQFEKAAAFAEKVPETVLPMRRWHLTGRIAERLGNHAEAFANFQSMNDAARAETIKESGASFRERLESQMAQWTTEWASSWHPANAPDDGQRDPIFLVGFPRSGTTLLDTMLMGTDELSVLEERPMLAHLLKSVGGDDLASLDANRIVELREQYFNVCRAEGWVEDKWLLDKHPLNMRNALLINRVFPRAKIILAERHPYDAVLSCFMANFKMNHGMRSFTSLEEAARTYDTVWKAWQKATEIASLDWHAVRYERLVENPRRELTSLVDWLGLDWREEFLDHVGTAQKRGVVRTASYSQIRENLYSRSVDRWRNYEKELAPVIPILSPWVEALDYRY
ncbi:MAG: hypothetical protein DI637_03345 [Citromicrobium sp.]|nr:MAG: hypothetical protein DI637_03345 [Citromicrobium sp.]